MRRLLTVIGERHVEARRLTGEIGDLLSISRQVSEPLGCHLSEGAGVVEPGLAVLDPQCQPAGAMALHRLRDVIRERGEAVAARLTVAPLMVTEGIDVVGPDLPRHSKSM